MPDTIANKHVLLALKKQPFRRYKGSDSALTRTLETLTDSAEGRAWQTAALQQTPSNLWAHTNELTVYQVWVVYRVAVWQLKLFHPDRGQDNSCHKFQCCKGVKETLEHLPDMFVRGSLLAEAHLPLDRRTLGAWTAPGLPSKQCKQTRARTIQGGPGSAHQTPPRRGSRICCRVETHMAHPEQRLHRQLVD